MTKVSWNSDKIDVDFKVVSEQPGDDTDKLQPSRFSVRLTDTATKEAWQTNMTADELAALRAGTLVW